MELSSSAPAIIHAGATARMMLIVKTVKLYNLHGEIVMSTFTDMDTFDVGALIALGLMANLHGEPGMAADIANEMQLNNADLRKYGLSEYDIANIQLLNNEGLSIKL